MTTIVWITVAGILIFYFVIASKTNKCFIGGISSSYKNLACNPQTATAFGRQSGRPQKYGMGLIPSRWPSGSQLLLSTTPASVSLPTSWDWMNKKYILGGAGSDTSPFDQGQCNSCYIVAPISCLGDRIAIKLTQNGHEVKKPIVAAPIAPLSCACNLSSSAAQVCGGINGGDIYSVGNWIVDHPIPTNKCYPLPLQDDSNPPPISCITKFSKCGCPNVGEENIKLKTSSSDGQTYLNKLNPGEISALKKKIHDDGPVTVGIWANGLENVAGTDNVFQGGDPRVDGHAVVLTGWDNKRRAWRVRNSWGINQNFWLSYDAEIIEIATVTPDISDELVTALKTADYISSSPDFVTFGVAGGWVSHAFPLVGAILLLLVLCYAIANT
jgi:hypothetical protein